MNQAIGQSITFAVGVAISPLPVVAVILMLLSKRSGANSTAFAIGWVGGIAAALLAVVVIGSVLDVNSHSSSSVDGTGTLKLVLGILLVIIGIRRIRRHGAPGETQDPPKWLVGVENVGSGRALGLGVALAALNPKNLILIIGGGLALAQTSASTPQKFVAGIVFAVLASVTVVAPVVAYRLFRARATPVLADLRAWLFHHAGPTVGVVLVIFGTLLIGRGIGGF